MAMATGSVPTERPSLRRRLAGTFAALALLITLAQAAFVWVIGDRAEEQLIDRVASEQLQRSMAIFWQQPELAQPNTSDMALHVVAEGDTAAEAALPDWLRELPRRAGSYEIFPGPGIEYHIAIGHDRDSWFYLVYDVAEHEVRQRKSMAALALSAFAIGALVLLVSGRLVARLTRDLDRLSQAVVDDREPTAQHSRPSFDSLAAHAETGRLARALDAYRDRLGQVLQRERAFSAAASHELRTPLMRAGSSLDLLMAGSLDPHEREIALRVQDSLDEMAMLTGALLRVARGQTTDAARAVDLAELVAAVTGHLAGEARARGIEVRLAVPSRTCRYLDRSALWIVLVNLLRNAIRHSGGGTITVAWHKDSLAIEDDGIGIGKAWFAGRVPPPAQAGQPVPERNLGLGLAIAERICEAAGWRLVIHDCPDGGTRASIALGTG